MQDLADLSDQLRNRGLVRLDGFIPRARIDRARNAILDLAREHGLLIDGVWDRSHSRFGLPKPFRAMLNQLHSSEDFPQLFGDELITLTSDLIGEAVVPLAPAQQILFTLPAQGDWIIPHDVWHLDVPRLGKDRSPGLQAFTFIDDVQPRGGATLVITGSHRFLNDAGHLPSKKVKQLLLKEDYFQHLFSRDRPASSQLKEFVGQVDDVHLEVVELSGRAGDVYLMDLRMLHTPAPNASETARMMVTSRMPRVSIAAQIGTLA